MIKAVEHTGEFDNHLSNVYSINWKQLCDFTHTGIQQIQRWNTSSGIEPNYSENEILDVIRFSRIYAYAAAVSIAEEIVEDNSLANEIFEKGKEGNR
ncbi:MAG TPA: hypothetical protein VGD04_07620 [Methylophilus sp.]